MLKDLCLVHFHPGEDLLTHEARLQLIERCAIDQPGEVDGDWVALVSWSVLLHIVRQEFVVLDLGAKVRPHLLLLHQVIIVVLEEVGLLVRADILPLSFLILLSILT